MEKSVWRTYEIKRITKSKKWTANSKQVRSNTRIIDSKTTTTTTITRSR
jgi:hypothetical protein